MKTNYDKIWGLLFSSLFVMAAAFTIYMPTLIFSWLFHASNTADLSQIERVIAINQEEYDRASTRISALSEGSAEFRFNADAPVAAMVGAQVVLAEKLVTAKEKKTTLFAKIISRCNGPWAPVVWIVDDVSCDDYRKM